MDNITNDWLNDFLNDETVSQHNQKWAEEDQKPKNQPKTNNQRLAESFEEINSFVDKHGREPEPSSMSEYGLMASLKSIRQNHQQKIELKILDRHNLLGEVEMPNFSIDDILDDDDFQLLNIDNEDLEIFKFKYITEKNEREKADFIAQRKAMKDKDFEPYKTLFEQVHQELKQGQRKLLPFHNIEKNLQSGNFYLIDGVMLYLKEAKLKNVMLKGENIERLEGRTFTIFENGTYSHMLYRSLGKQIQKNGKLITNSEDNNHQQLYINSGMVQEEDVPTGYIYVLKSKSAHPAIAGLQNLYKIGFASADVDQRIKNAKHEATYLYAEVTKVASYACYNRQADKLELLLHRFFAHVCLDIDLELIPGKRITPREWFVLPLPVIQEAIELILNEQIINYKYDKDLQQIVLK